MTEIATTLHRSGLQALIANNGSDFTNFDLFRANIGIPSVFRDIVLGLKLSTGGRAHIGTDTTTGGSPYFTIGPGMAVASDFSDTMLKTTAYVKSVAAWSLGSNGGALDTGVIAPNTLYTVFQMKRFDSSEVDYSLSLNRTAPTLGVNIPPAYTKFQPIGRARTDDISRIYRVYQWDSLKYKPTVALSAHTYRSVYDNGRAALLESSMPITFYTIPESIDIVGAQGLLRAELIVFQSLGEVAAYTNADMVALRAAGREVALDRLTTMKSVMQAKGFYNKAIITESRQWSDELADLSRCTFPNVMVTSLFDEEPYPIADTNNVKGGGMDAFGPASTLAEFQARLDLLELTGGLLLPAIHNLGTGDANSLSVPVYTSIIAELQTRRDANRIRVCAVSEAMTPTPFR